MDSIKLCECGCGQPTSIVRVTQANLGRFVGSYSRFIRGHQIRKPLPTLKDILENTTRGDAGCMLWRGGLTSSGYGEVRRAGKTLRVHRLVYELAHGHPPGQKLVRHTCDTPACINPEHLLLGTTADNVADKLLRCRQAVGAQNGRAKLEHAEVLEILSKLSAGESRRDIAGWYGVSVATVADIASNRSWKHIPRGSVE